MFCVVLVLCFFGENLFVKKYTISPNGCKVTDFFELRNSFLQKYENFLKKGDFLRRQWRQLSRQSTPCRDGGNMW